MNYLPWLNRWLNPVSFLRITNNSSDTEPALSPQPISWYRRASGVVLVVIGYLLSPLCWWNDVVFNLPLALGFGYLFSRVYPDAFVPLTIVGYWLSNVVGFVMMQQGAVAALQRNAQPQDPRKAFINGLVTSTVYTVAIVALLQFHILDTPDIFSGDFWNQLDAMLPDWWSFGTQS